MISFKRKNGAKGILRENKFHKDLIVLNLIGQEKLPGLWLMALHTHTQFSDFPGESVYTKNFAITD